MASMYRWRGEPENVMVVVVMVDGSDDGGTRDWERGFQSGQGHEFQMLPGLRVTNKLTFFKARSGPRLALALG